MLPHTEYYTSGDRLKINPYFDGNKSHKPGYDRQHVLHDRLRQTTINEVRFERSSKANNATDGGGILDCA